MKRFISKLLLFSSAFIVLQGCSLNDDGQYCYYRNYRAAEFVTGPTTAPVNTDVQFQVTFSLGNSCGVFYDFAEFNTTYPREIAAAVDYTGCECTPSETEITKPYTFRATTPGTYELHFLTENEETPIVKIIEITQ